MLNKNQKCEYIHHMFIRIFSAFIHNPSKRKDFRKKHLIKKSVPYVNTTNNEIIIINENGQKLTVQNVPGLNIEFLGENSKIILSEKTTFYHCHFAVGNNNIIEIEKTPYRIENSETTGEILNKPTKGISIGNHCWICRGSTFLKNTGIGDNCIVGASSLITKTFEKTHVIIAGTPAKIIKNSINWDRENTYYYEQKEGVK